MVNWRQWIRIIIWIHCWYDEDNALQNEENTFQDENIAMQNEDNTLKYKVNQATLLPLHLKIKITATEL